MVGKKSIRDEVLAQIEVLLYASQEPISMDQLHAILLKVNADISISEIEEAIAMLESRYQGSSFGIELKRANTGFKLVTKANHHKIVAYLLDNLKKNRLSKPALETLSIIAHLKKATKTEIEEIRGVSSDYSIEKLLQKKLIEISGKRQTLGNPTEYSLSDFFYDYFDLKNSDELQELLQITSI
ncbi:MAG: SMC-Scp complex subunit ScpB [Chitinophagales bacterium]|jgi:segregation and condensation protein B|nr:SMC-Scp complex subunit ScpB [Chitinophagales bacterium]